MNVREKLVELLRSAYGTSFNAPYLSEHELEPLASHLIANGVTVQEWISVEDRLPDELPHGAVVWSDLVRPSACVLAIRKNNEMEVAWYSYANGWWTTPDEMFSFQGVTHWMPLPQPPKGE